jgi:lipopolysaccharide/colanic/teichoic acid biosynthesis glycosyltransferase
MTTDSGSATALELDPPATSAVGVSGRGASHPVHRTSHGPRVVPIGRARRQGARLGRMTDEIGDVLPKSHFVAQLRREMRRADRSQAHLSVAVFRASGETESESATLLRLLADSKRETDILGQLHLATAAVVCTDTGEDGVQQFAKKVERLADGFRYEVEVATYPSQLFEAITAAPSAPPPDSLFVSEPVGSSTSEYLLKRPLDILGATIAIALLMPVMLITALLVKLSSPGPVIFRQTRLGRGGRPFAFYKFRSMVAGNDDRIHRDYVKSLIKGENDKVDQADDVSRAGPLYKIKADPRITPIGRFIRGTSIDELPQLFNVLKGDMSLVGPRPPLPYEAENYRSWHLRRLLDVRPGITGLWQVEGRSRVTFDEMVRMDLRYMRSCSLGLDLRLLARTVLVVLRCDGAR